jgi:hypothetical protein
MAKPRKKKRQTGKRQIETALPKRQYKRTNRLLYILSGILLVVFGGGAALIGGGAPPPPPSPTPVISTPVTSPAGQLGTPAPTPTVSTTPATPTP